MVAAPQLSQIGEWTYVDYAHAISEGRLPVQGDPLGEYTLEAWSCRGMEGTVGGEAPPACAAVQDGAEARDSAALTSSDWPLNGENYNTFHPPLYFALAGLVGKAAAAVGLDFVDGARLFTAFLAAAGAMALYYAIRRWDIAKAAAAGGVLLAMSTPLMAEASGIVHNDAPAMLFGAAAVWLAARIWKERNGDWAIPAAIAATISLTRTMSVLAVLGVGLIAGVHGLIRWRNAADRRTLLPPAIAIGAATAASYLAWTAFHNSRVPDGYVPAVTGVSTSPFEGTASLGPLIESFFNRGPYGLTGPGHWILHGNLDSPVMTVWSWVTYALFLAALIAVPLTVHRMARRDWPLAALVLLLPILASFIVQVRELITADAYFRFVPGRYAITAVPVYGAALALVADRLSADKVVLALGTIGYGALLLTPFV